MNIIDQTKHVTKNPVHNEAQNNGKKSSFWTSRKVQILKICAVAAGTVVAIAATIAAIACTIIFACGVGVISGVSAFTGCLIGASMSIAFLIGTGAYLQDKSGLITPKQDSELEDEELKEIEELLENKAAELTPELEDEEPNEIQEPVENKAAKETYEDFRGMSTEDQRKSLIQGTNSLSDENFNSLCSLLFKESNNKEKWKEYFETFLFMPREKQERIFKEVINEVSSEKILSLGLFLFNVINNRGKWQERLRRLMPSDLTQDEKKTR